MIPLLLMLSAAKFGRRLTAARSAHDATLKVMPACNKRSCRLVIDEIPDFPEADFIKH